jgi:hypothetical protein
MTKRLVALTLCVLLVLGLAACRTDPATTDEPEYKIGIITGTVSQGEEEYQAAQNMASKYGDIIVTATYPDNFASETETTIANTVALASDPDVKAIVFVQAVPGTAAAIDKVRETRPDMLFIAGVAAEDPATIASKADIVLLVDEISMGTAMPKKAAEMGAKTFIHYSFARHLSYATIAARRNLIMQTCEELGIDYYDVTAPDPLGDSGVSGAQQFILEDVPRQIERFGKDTAFFSTNCAMQEPLIRSILEQGAIFPQQCCPSPYHGYPAALNIDVSGHEGDVQYMLDSIQTALKEHGQEGRMSTWGTPVNMLMIEAGVEYAMDFLEGETDGRVDEEALVSIIQGLAGSDTRISKYEADGVSLDNFFLILCDFYDFAQ